MRSFTFKLKFLNYTDYKFFVSLKKCSAPTTTLDCFRIKKLKIIEIYQVLANEMHYFFFGIWLERPKSSSKCQTAVCLCICYKDERYHT